MRRMLSNHSNHDFRIGVHIIMIKSENACSIPVSEHQRIGEKVLNTALICQCKLKAFFAMPDHMHVLIEATDDEGVSEFIPELARVTEAEICEIIGHQRSSKFSWNENVHVTLLPPWHLEILASFVRDQERYHQTRDVEQEISEIFKPDAMEEEVVMG